MTIIDVLDTGDTAAIRGVKTFRPSGEPGPMLPDGVRARQPEHPDWENMLYLADGGGGGPAPIADPRKTLLSLRPRPPRFSAFGEVAAGQVWLRPGRRPEPRPRAGCHTR